MIHLIPLEVSSEKDLLDLMNHSKRFRLFSIPRKFITEHLSQWEQGVVKTGLGYDYHMYWKQIAEDEWLVIQISLNIFINEILSEVIDLSTTAALWRYQRYPGMEERVNTYYEMFNDPEWEHPGAFTFYSTFEVVFLLIKERNSRATSITH